MAVNEQIAEFLYQQNQIIDLSFFIVLFVTILAMTLIFAFTRTYFVMNRNTRRDSYRTQRQLDEMKDNLRHVSHEILVSEGNDKKRMEEIKLMLSASSLYDGTKNQKLVDELKELQNRNKFHGIDIVIKERAEDDYRTPETLVKGEPSDEDLIK